MDLQASNQGTVTHRTIATNILKVYIHVAYYSFNTDTWQKNTIETSVSRFVMKYNDGSFMIFRIHF